VSDTVAGSAGPAPDVRREETELVLDALDAESGRIIEILGEPGSGKSRLIAKVAVEARRRGVPVLNNRYTEERCDIALNIADHLLNDLAYTPNIAPPSERAHDVVSRFLADPETFDKACDRRARAQVCAALRQLLAWRAGQGGLVVILDDFHCADESNVEFIEYLARHPVDVPLIVVLAQRPRQTSARLRGALAYGVELDTVRRVELGPLSVEQSAELLGLPAADHRVTELHRESGGIPLYLLALAAADQDQGVPYQIAALLDEEIARLDAVQSRVLEAAAVLGGSFGADEVAAVAELDAGEARAAVVRLTGRDLLRPIRDTTTFTLRHPLVGRAVYAGTDPAWRLSAHRRAADVLGRRGAPATARAAHVEHAITGAGADDLDVLRRAADHALLTDPPSAVRWLSAALRVQDDDAPGRVTDQLNLARALGLTGRLGDGRDLLHATLLRVPDEDRETRASAVGFCALLDALLSNYAEARELLAAELAGRGETPGAAETAVLHGFVSLLDHRHPPRRRAEQARRLARRNGDRLTEAGALALSALCDVLDDQVTRAGDAADAAAVLVDRLSDAELAPHLEYAAALGWAEAFTGRLSEARRHFRRGAAIAYGRRYAHVLPLLHLGLANIRRHTDEPAEAVRLAAETRAAAERIDAQHIRGLALALESLAAGYAEGPAAATALAEKAAAALRGVNPHWEMAAALAQGNAARLNGDPRRCVSVLLAAGGGPTLPRVPTALRPPCFELLARAAAEADDDAGVWARRAEAAAEFVGLPMQRAYAMTARAHALHSAGRPAEALGRYRQATDVFSAVGLASAQARTLAIAAACADSAGGEETDEAGAAVRESTRRTFSAWFEIERRWLGGRRIKRRRRDPLSPLTEREREIATLAGSGMRTREIAEKLCVSPRTVDVHLTRIYRKLNIGSRAFLARMMATLD